MNRDENNLIFESYVKSRRMLKESSVREYVSNDEVRLEEFPDRIFAYDDIPVCVEVEQSGHYEPPSRWSPGSDYDFSYTDGKIVRSEHDVASNLYEINDEGVPDQLDMNDTEAVVALEREIIKHGIRQAEQNDSKPDDGDDDDFIEPDPDDNVIDDDRADYLNQGYRDSPY